jgi:hypothetical protein
VGLAPFCVRACVRCAPLTAGTGWGVGRSPANDDVVAALAAAGFVQMLEKCIAANSSNPEATDMVRRASQALQVLSAGRAAVRATEQPEETAAPQSDASVAALTS